MLQRIQTVWLLLAGLTIFGLFLFPYLQYIDVAGLGRKLLVTGSYTAVNGESIKEESFILQMIATVVLGLLPVYIIFKFKDRKTQIKLVFLEIVLIILFALWLYSSSSSILASTSQYLSASNIGVGFFLLPVAIIFLSMALGGIRKDEQLIKSAERLR
jgi:phosphoglycerol transferase MdoB-like AlkP superfamily enzyme